MFSWSLPNSISSLLACRVFSEKSPDALKSYWFQVLLWRNNDLFTFGRRKFYNDWSVLAGCKSIQMVRAFNVRFRVLRVKYYRAEICLRCRLSDHAAQCSSFCWIPKASVPHVIVTPRFQGRYICSQQSGIARLNRIFSLQVNPDFVVFYLWIQANLTDLLRTCLRKV